MIDSFSHIPFNLVFMEYFPQRDWRKNTTVINLRKLSCVFLSDIILETFYRNNKKNMVNILCYIYTVIYNNKINAGKPCPKQAPV